MRSRIFLLTLAGFLSLSLTSEILNAPDINDYLAKGKIAISELQDFNFQLQFNLFTTGGAETTLQSMKKMSQNLRTYASSGMGAVYTELYNTQSVYGSLDYLQQNFQWPRTAYMSKYQLAFGQQSSDCFYKLQYSCKKIEFGFSQLY